MIESDIVIIGGGASGLMAAFYAATYNTNNRTRIIILEHKDSVGKKILATGNGRCNFTNMVTDNESYRGTDPDFAYNILKQYNTDWLITEFNKLGIIETEVNGYIYPRSLQAAAILNALKYQLNNKVDIRCSIDAQSISRTNNNYIIKTNSDTYISPYIVIATGGMSYKHLGSDGSGYKLAKDLGHMTSICVPSLVGLRARGLNFKTCSGVRAKGRITINSNGTDITTSKGEIQYTDYGISGIPVFQVSRYASMELAYSKKVMAHIDLLPEYNFSDIYSYVSKHINHNTSKSISDVFNAFIPLKLANAVIESKGIKSKCSCSTINEKVLKTLCYYIKNIELTITGDCGFDKSQVTAGGILTDDIYQNNMESKLAKNAYITGELLDIDGNCGGYNLHFAFATGAIAGIDIAGKVSQK